MWAYSRYAFVTGGMLWRASLAQSERERERSYSPADVHRGAAHQAGDA